MYILSWEVHKCLLEPLEYHGDMVPRGLSEDPIIVEIRWLLEPSYKKSSVSVYIPYIYTYICVYTHVPSRVCITFPQQSVDS